MDKTVIWSGTYNGDKWRIIVSDTNLHVEKLTTHIDALTYKKTDLWRHEMQPYVLHQALLDIAKKGVKKCG